MIFEKTELAGVHIIKMEPQKDERGFFARAFCKEEFLKHGLCGEFVQNSYSYNAKKGILRGMHFQESPFEEVKLVSCVRGSVYDVALDLRIDSETYGKWLSVELSAKNGYALYIPKGFAHGFQVLEDDTMMYYQISELYHPEKSRTVSFKRQEFSIQWPIEEKIISEKDMMAD